MKIQYSQMKKRVFVYSQIKDLDDFGGYKIKWEKFDEIWAKLESVIEENTFSKVKHSTKSAYNFYIRKNINIEMPMRILCDGQCYGIGKKSNRSV
ncbi:MAG: SPP1 family predicted phage head-tail adaptor [Candidatus Midichloriaceae bacterium]|jgi:SPP1 family predicted phage head-tail adaptor